MKNVFYKLSIRLGFSFIFLLFIQIAAAQNLPKDRSTKQSIFVNLIDTSKHSKGQTGKKNLEDGVDDNILMRQQQEIRMTMDPKTKTVPVERLIEARKFRDGLLARPSSKALLKNGNSIASSNLNWTERGPNNVGGRTRALMFDLNDKANGYKKVFAGGVDGGLWYTNDITAATISWTKINDFFANIAISCIVQDPINPLIIYAGTGEGWYNGDSESGLGVWKTSDGGKTWAQLTSTSSFAYINSILVDKNENLYIAGNGIGVQKSKDGGSTWAQVLGTSNGQASNDGADLQMALNGDIYATLGLFYSYGQVFLSDFAINASNTGDQGKWTNITPDYSGNIYSYNNNIYWWRIKLACAPSNPNITYALFEGAYSYGLASFQQYNKATNTWTVKSQPQEAFQNGQAWYSMALTVDPNNANVLYSGSLDGESSIDGGNNWQQVTQWYTGELQTLDSTQYVHADHHAYVFAPGSSSRLLMGTDGGIFYSNNADATKGALPQFIDRNHGYNVTQFYSAALHPTDLNYALGGTQDNGSQQFTTSGLNATNEVTGGDGAFTHIDQINPNIQITSYVGSNYFISKDGGKNFNYISFGLSALFINPTDYDSFSQTLYGTTYYNQYFRWKNVSDFSNAQADVINVSNFNNNFVTALAVSPNVLNRVYFGLSDGSIVRVDSANTVNNQTNGVLLKPTDYNNFANVSSISIDPSNENHLLVSYSNYGVQKLYETKDASAKPVVWLPIEGNLPDMPVRWAMFYPDFPTKAIIATELGVWTTDSLNSTNTSWQPSNNGLANVSTYMLKYRALDRTLIAATHGRGMFTTTLSTLGKTLSQISLSAKSLVSYGDADFTIQATSNNPAAIVLKSSDPTVATVSSTGVVHIVGAGTTVISATQTASGNFIKSPTIYKTITVLPVELDIKADNKIKFVGTANPPLTFTYSGFKNKDTPDSLTTKPSVSTIANDQSAIGAYQIIVGGAVSTNYVPNYINGVLNVVQTEGVPTITSLSPNGGQSGGTVNITGTNFATTSSVSFGGVPATSFVVNSSTSITAIIGNGASGDVVVTNLAGTTKFSGFNYIFSLPDNNFKVTIASVTCNGGNDGKINITAAQHLSYTATLSGNSINTPYNFTDSLTISNLATGTYSLCVTLASQPSYQQCFTVVLTQPKALSVYTNLNTTTNTLQLLLGGGAKYQIKLNGQTYNTEQSTYELPLIDGVNELQVSTDLACQGIYSKVINLTGNNAPYPQPFESTININTGNKVYSKVSFSVYSIIDGKKVYTTSLSNQGGVVQLDLSSLEPGIYSLQMNLDNFEKTYKIIKK
jgi:photosystem II stability/assembly factor-like uncharacterized protein